MNKNDLLKILVATGLAVTDTACTKSDDMPLPKERNDDQKEVSLKSSPDTFVPFTPIAEIELPQNIQNEMIAVARLTHDIFYNPELAQRFSENPEAYVESIGLPEVTLELNSLEIRAAIAMGDPDIRNAIMRNDLIGYVALLEERYIDYTHIQIDKDLEEFLKIEIERNPELKRVLSKYKDDNLSFRAAYPIFVAVPMVAYAMYAVASQAAIAYNAAAAINAYAAINLSFWLNVHSSVNTSTNTSSSISSSASSTSAFNVDSSSVSTSSVNTTQYSYFQTMYPVSSSANSYVVVNTSEKIHSDITDVHDNVITRNPVIKIWGAETNNDDIPVLHQLIENNVEDVAKMIESSKFYQEAEEKITPEELRNILRKPITQKMVDQGLL